MCENRLTMYGSVVSKTRLVGFCLKHRVGLTSGQLKKKKCLAKTCRHLQKYPDHEFWHQRELKKALKKQHRKEVM